MATSETPADASEHLMIMIAVAGWRACSGRTRLPKRSKRLIIQP
ncbi:MAG: hypothetical protein ACXWNQ_03260 [Anaerolineales bacterium]